MTLLRWKIGDVTITRVPEVIVKLALGEFLPEATPAAVAPHRGWLEPHFLAPDGTFELSIHGLVVDTGDLRILVDTCVGKHPIPGFDDLAAGAADFLAALADAGYARETIDVVLCTHMHFDHVGWNTMREGDRLRADVPERAVSVRARGVGALEGLTGSRRLREHVPGGGGPDRRGRARGSRRVRPQALRRGAAGLDGGTYARPRIGRDRLAGRARVHHRRHDPSPGAVGRARLEDARRLRLGRRCGDPAAHRRRARQCARARDRHPLCAAVRGPAGARRGGFWFRAQS